MLASGSFHDRDHIKNKYCIATNVCMYNVKSMTMYGSYSGLSYTCMIYHRSANKVCMDG